MFIENNVHKVCDQQHPTVRVLPPVYGVVNVLKRLWCAHESSESPEVKYLERITFAFARAGFVWKSTDPRETFNRRR